MELYTRRRPFCQASPTGKSALRDCVIALDFICICICCDSPIFKENHCPFISGGRVDKLLYLCVGEFVGSLSGFLFSFLLAVSFFGG